MGSAKSPPASHHTASVNLLHAQGAKIEHLVIGMLFWCLFVRDRCNAVLHFFLSPSTDSYGHLDFPDTK